MQSFKYLTFDFSLFDMVHTCSELSHVDGFGIISCELTAEFERR